ALCLLMKTFCSDFVVGPRHDASAQFARTHQALHELDLVETYVQEKVGEFNNRLFREIAAAIKVITTLQIAGGELVFVSYGIPSQTTSDGPKSARVECIAKHGIRDQPRHAAVAVKKWMNPKKPVVRGSDIQHRLKAAERGIRPLPIGQMAVD